MITTIQNDQDLLFKFNDAIDPSFVKDHCCEDLEFCLNIFDAFLATAEDEIKGLQIAVSYTDYEKISFVAERLSPNFTMIGLPQDGRDLTLIAQKAQNEFIEPLTNLIITRLFNHIAIVKEDTVRLREYLAKKK
jgi:hypothetical protein